MEELAAVAEIGERTNAKSVINEITLNFLFTYDLNHFGVSTT